MSWIIVFLWQINQEPVFVPGVWGPYFSAMVPGLWLSEGGQSVSGKLVTNDTLSQSQIIEEENLLFKILLLLF